MGKVYFSMLLLLGAGLSGCGGTSTPVQLPVQPTVTTRLTTWGSSSLEFIDANIKQQLTTLQGSYTYQNQSKAGELVLHTLARIGIRPNELAWSDADQGYISKNGVPAKVLMKPYQGTFEAGSNRYDLTLGTKAVQGKSPLYTIKMNGVDVPRLSGVFLPQPIDYRRGINIVWIGKNDIRSGRDPQTIYEQTKAICQTVDMSSTGKCLVMTHFPDPSWESTDPQYVSLQRVNQLYKNDALLTVFDAEQYLSNPALINDLKTVDPRFEWTAADTRAHSLGALPPSLVLRDGIHLKPLVNQVLTQELFENLQSRKWINIRPAS